MVEVTASTAVGAQVSFLNRCSIIEGPWNRSNISSPGWRLIVQPAPGWTVQVKQRFWYLAQAGLLQDPTGGSGNYFGHDVQLRLQWAISSNLDFDVLNRLS